MGEFRLSGVISTLLDGSINRGHSANDLQDAILELTSGYVHGGWNGAIQARMFGWYSVYNQGKKQDPPAFLLCNA
ncbi:hypothetical protein HAX54_049439 [Datura stramonium]|uniref:Uncharacterized protein n=1 Tax=Datura stramonium TaxID=4076 RepID=A0ABS8WPD7_DATST|nr:hypothetical protein [Datura stramonium]